MMFVICALQVTSNTFCREKIREFGRGIEEARKMKKALLKFLSHAIFSIRLRAYADASFASNENLSTKLGYLIFMCDKDDVCHILDLSCRKPKHIFQSIMAAAKVFAFLDAFDAGVILVHNMFANN